MKQSLNGHEQCSEISEKKIQISQPFKILSHVSLQYFLCIKVEPHFIFTGACSVSFSKGKIKCLPDTGNEIF